MVVICGCSDISVVGGGDLWLAMVMVVDNDGNIFDEKYG